MRRIPGSEVWLKADLVSILRGLWLTTLAARGDAEYTRGFLAAIVVLATAVGIPDYEVKR